MRDILFFDTMLTPKVITFIYWLALLVVLISGLGTLFGGYGGLTPGKLLWGLLIVVGGAVSARIWCELLIVLFKIHENIRKIAERPQ